MTLLLFIFALDAAFVTAVALWFRHHTKHPAPGKVSPGTPAADSPPRPSPAPGHHVAFTVTTWRCGHMRAWDGHGHTIAVRECHCRRRADWGQWESELSET